MAAEKTKRRRRAEADDPGTGESAAEATESTEKAEKKAKARPKADAPKGSALRLLSAPRKERRFEPTASPSAWISVLGMSIGAVLLGAGAYGEWLRGPVRQWLKGAVDPEMAQPHPYAAYLLVAGALLLALVTLLGPRAARPVRVGDAGLGLEKGGDEIERLEWRDVSRILADADAITFQGPGAVVSIPLKQHAQAAARALAEAKARIPKKLEDVDTSAIPRPDPDAGEVRPLEAAQLAGSRCRASDELIAFEKDARLCGRCGEVYHKAHVPSACLTCEASLK
jgi:sRNA-binding protein